MKTSMKHRNPNLIDLLDLSDEKRYTMYDYERLQKDIVKLKKSYDDQKEEEIKRMIDFYKDLDNKNAIN